MIGRLQTTRREMVRRLKICAWYPWTYGWVGWGVIRASTNFAITPGINLYSFLTPLPRFHVAAYGGVSHVRAKRKQATNPVIHHPVTPTHNTLPVHPTLGRRVIPCRCHLEGLWVPAGAGLKDWRGERNAIDSVTVVPWDVFASRNEGIRSSSLDGWDCKLPQAMCRLVCLHVSICTSLSVCISLSVVLFLLFPLPLTLSFALPV